MDYLINKEIKKIIKSSLGEDDKINESYVAQPKSFDVTTDYLSAENIENHKKLYEDYVSKFNETSARLDAVDRSSANSNHSDYRNLKLDETFNMNGAYLHELYFANIGSASSTITMDSLSFMRLNRDFGSFDDWQKDFIACGKSSRCGWVVTYLNMYTQSYMNCFIDLHAEQVPVGMYPVIVMDMWQHAYYKDYLKDAPTYLNAMMKQLKWEVIESRIKKADKIIQIVRGAR
mgnify:CR=1 FL=1|tara:strand:+ start:633 stop:1328 length:696 start_codon:yes stop_codon:yes gene_type:complete